MAIVGVALVKDSESQVTELIELALKSNELGRHVEAIAIYDDVIASLGTASELPLREQIAKALFNKGVTLDRLGRHDEAVAAWDDVVARFGATSELLLREQVATALYLKMDLLRRLGERRKVSTVYADIISRFGIASEPAIRDIVQKTKFLRKAKQFPTLKSGRPIRAGEVAQVFDFTEISNRRAYDSVMAFTKPERHNLAKDYNPSNMSVPGLQGQRLNNTGRQTVVEYVEKHDPLSRLIERCRDRPDLAEAALRHIDKITRRPAYTKRASELTGDELAHRRKLEREKKARWLAKHRETPLASAKGPTG